MANVSPETVNSRKAFEQMRNGNAKRNRAHRRKVNAVTRGLLAAAAPDSEN